MRKGTILTEVCSRCTTRAGCALIRSVYRAWGITPVLADVASSQSAVSHRPGRGDCDADVHRSCPRRRLYPRNRLPASLERREQPCGGEYLPTCNALSSSLTTSVYVARSRRLGTVSGTAIYGNLSHQFARGRPPIQRSPHCRGSLTANLRTTFS